MVLSKEATWPDLLLGWSLFIMENEFEKIKIGGRKKYEVAVVETRKGMMVDWTRVMAVEVTRRDLRRMEESTLTLHDTSGHRVSYLGFLSEVRRVWHRNHCGHAQYLQRMGASKTSFDQVGQREWPNLPTSPDMHTVHSPPCKTLHMLRIECKCHSLCEAFSYTCPMLQTGVKAPSSILPKHLCLLHARNCSKCAVHIQVPALPGGICNVYLGVCFLYDFPMENQECLTSCAWCGRGWGGAGPGAGAAAAESDLTWPSDGSRCPWSCPGLGGYGPSLPETSECWTEMCTLLDVQRGREKEWEREKLKQDQVQEFDGVCGTQCWVSTFPSHSKGESLNPFDPSNYIKFLLWASFQGLSLRVPGEALLALGTQWLL